jgi:hypothetical protein
MEPLMRSSLNFSDILSVKFDSFQIKAAQFQRLLSRFMLKKQITKRRSLLDIKPSGSTELDTFDAVSRCPLSLSFNLV